MGLKIGVKRVLFNGVKATGCTWAPILSKATTKIFVPMAEILRTDGLSFLSRRVVQIYACFLSGHTLAL